VFITNRSGRRTLARRPVRDSASELAFIQARKIDHRPLTPTGASKPNLAGGFTGRAPSINIRRLSIPARRLAVPSSLTRIPLMGHIRRNPPKPYLSGRICKGAVKPSGKPANETSPSGQVDLQPAVPVIFSIGYEGRSLEEFIALLRDAGVERLIDVRDAPFSRKPGFSKAPLEQALKAAGIEYFGAPELGTDKASRERHRDGGNGGMDAVLEEYRRKLEGNVGLFRAVEKMARARPSAIMCYEADAGNCHRQVIEEKMALDGFKVVHLGECGQERLEDFDRR